MFDDLFNYLKEIFTALLDFIIDLIFIVFDAIVDLVFGFFDSLFADSGIIDLSGLVSQLPPIIPEIWAVLHLGECISIIISALIIRFMLQMIPFVRFGS